MTIAWPRKKAVGVSEVERSRPSTSATRASSGQLRHRSACPVIVTGFASLNTSERGIRCRRKAGGSEDPPLRRAGEAGGVVLSAGSAGELRPLRPVAQLWTVTRRPRQDCVALEFMGGQAPLVRPRRQPCRRVRDHPLA